MKSESKGSKLSYPFKLRELNLRYIDTKNEQITSKLIVGSEDYFPIIKDINVDVKVVSNGEVMGIDVFL